MSPSLILTILILFGVLLVLVEVLFLPGFGIGLLGLASLGAACWYTFAHFGSTAGIWATVILSVALLLTVLFVLRSKTWKKAELNAEIGARANTDNERIAVGEHGVTITRLAPRGTARFGGLSTEVKSADNSMVAPGTEVEVVATEYNEIIVKPINR